MKGRARLLTFLKDGPARVQTLDGAPGSAGDMLLRRDGTRMLTVELSACLSEGLAASGPPVTLSPEGAAWLKRWEARTTPDAFARQHQKRVEVALPVRSGGGSATVNLHESQLSRLAQRKDAAGRPWLDRKGVEAGDRLARDFTIGGLRQRVTSSWDIGPRGGRSGRGGQAELSDAAIDARTRLDRALGYLGPDLAGVAVDICCFAKGTSEVERERRWPPRSAKLMLRTALALLAGHYGLTAGAGRQASHTRSWKAAT